MARSSVLKCAGHVCRADLWRIMKYLSELITGTDGRSWRREELRELSRISQRRRSAASIRRGREEHGRVPQGPVHVGRRKKVAVCKRTVSACSVSEDSHTT